MCGIAAIFAYGEMAPPVDREELLRMRDQMASRGPDGEGEWFSEDRRVGLGHRRLSIIDLSPAGAEPMFNHDRSVAIIFNGEIYNYQELRQQLLGKGYPFRGHCDAEVVLALYETEGEGMLNKLRGMYAFAVWDSKKRGLFLARDPFGIKPLYYSDNGRTIRVASQVKALRAGGNIDSTPDPAGHVGFFVWGHVPDPYTALKSIRSLPAGHTMWIDRGGARSPREFCSITSILRDAEEAALGDTQRSMANTQLHERLGSALSETVRYHLVADVPVGIFLSSGLDSTIITALASEQGGDLRTVTLGFEEYKGTVTDEVPLAEQFAKRCGAQHQTIWVSRADFESERDHLFDAMDRPSIDGVNTFFVSLAAKQAGLKVAMSGVGGDELFGSYPSFQDIPRMVNLFKSVGSRLPGFGGKVRTLAAPVLKRFTSPKYAGVFEYGGRYSGAYLLRRGMFMPWELPELIDPEMVREGWAELQTLLRLDETQEGISSPRLKVSALEMSWYMRHQLLRDSDWAGMGHSVEIRVPLADLELLRQLAPVFVRQPGIAKREVATAASPLIGADILDRPKTGFQVPVRDWLMSQARYGSFRTRRPVRTRGLRGWAREVYSHFFPLTGELKLTAKPRNVRPVGNRSKLRALMLLTDGFGGFGGIAKFNRDFLTALSSSDDVESVVAIPRLMQDDPGPLPNKLAYVTSGLGGKGRYLRALLRSARDIRASKKPDTRVVVFCGHINLLPAAMAAQRITGGDLFLNIHGIDAWQPTLDPLVNACVKQIDDFISVSSVTRRRFLQWAGLGMDKGVVLPNCVDLEAFRPGPKSLELVRRFNLEGARVLLTLGRLASEERYKGFDEVIECLPDIGKAVPNVVYLIAGDGPDRPRLVQKARKLGLRVDDLAVSEPSEARIQESNGSAPRVIFAGRVKDEVKADYFRLADLFVMPSSGEGFGIVLLEAMACGVPVIGSKIDGSREALRQGELGTLVDPRNLPEITSAIIENLTDPRVGSTVVEGVEYFSTQRFNERVRTMLGAIRGANTATPTEKRKAGGETVSAFELSTH